MSKAFSSPNPDFPTQGKRLEIMANMRDRLADMNLAVYGSAVTLEDNSLLAGVAAIAAALDARIEQVDKEKIYNNTGNASDHTAQRFISLSKRLATIFEESATKVQAHINTSQNSKFSANALSQLANIAAAYVAVDVRLETKIKR